MSTNNPKILECTLRDGSYTIDFQFTAQDTRVIASALQNVGFRLIEIGHGLGLNASTAGKGEAAATDEEYLRAAASVLDRVKWGMFFIPGIGRHEDLDLAAKYGMGFVRVGTNAPEIETAKEYVEHAKSLGMLTAVNMMKSYVLSPKELALNAKKAEEFGCDIVYLVDSAGSLLPEQMREYILALREALAVPIGFHGHDNLSLGIANSLVAIEAGAEYVDSTLQGMGRGGGNAVTEVLLTVLKKKGMDLGISLNQTMDISHRIIKPLLKDKGWDSIDITSGFAGFHSSYLKTILKYSDQYAIDPRDLIVEVCQVDQVHASEEMVEELARQLRENRKGTSGLHFVSLPHFVFDNDKNEKYEDGLLSEAVFHLARKINATAKKSGKQSVFNIVAATERDGKVTVSRFIQEEFDYVIGSVELDTVNQLRDIIRAIDGKVDILLIDEEQKSYLPRSLAFEAVPDVNQSKLIPYHDSEVWIRSVFRQISAVFDGVRGKKIAIFGMDKKGLRLSWWLHECGAEITMIDATEKELDCSVQALRTLMQNSECLNANSDCIEAAGNADAIVSFDCKNKPIRLQVVRAMSKEGVVFDAGIGAVNDDAIRYCHEHAIRILRPDMRAALAAELTLALGTKHMVSEIMGKGSIDGVPVVAGGVIGQYGDIIVDSVCHPTRVVGVADGRGTVLYDSPEEFLDSINKVEKEIFRQKVISN